MTVNQLRDALSSCFSLSKVVLEIDGAQREILRVKEERCLGGAPSESTFTVVVCVGK